MKPIETDIAIARAQREIKVTLPLSISLWALNGVNERDNEWREIIHNTFLNTSEISGHVLTNCNLIKKVKTLLSIVNF